MKDFKYELGDSVTMLMSDETGTIKGRAEYRTAQNQYYVLYKAADGRQVEDWWGEDRLAVTIATKLAA